MKQIREISDCSAYIVLDKKGQHAATVQFRYGSGGGVQCDVWSRKDGYLQLTHQKKAGGYGYDKAAAALAGAEIDGYRMADHCGRVEEKGEKKRAALLRAYLRRVKAGEMSREEHREFEEKARRMGCRFANWNTPALGNGSGWGSLHNESGLDRLRAFGYQIITAI